MTEGKSRNAPSLAQQLVVRPALGDDAVLEHKDAVGILNGRETVGDGDGRAVLGGFVERALDDLLRLRVKRRSSSAEGIRSA